MDGQLRIGAVGAVPWLRHPVTLARRVLDDGEHAFLVGRGALEFAALHDIHPEAPEALVTERARRRLEAERAGRLAPSATGDTVGACAVDASGRVAAASSTGGISYKRRGRVGDSPLAGAGLYADDAAGAATATGHGESILRALVTRHAIEWLRAGEAARAAAEEAVAELERRTGGQGGLVVVDRAGRVGQARNTRYLPWASVQEGRREGGT
jgi:beta-aspartyl-peptidase (threonine type)